jgi:hypothetical protein
LNLYEVVRYGNDSDDIYSGGADGPDTCFLVRANSPCEAADLVSPLLEQMPHEKVQACPHVVYLLGTHSGVSELPLVLRGPYIEHAYNHGWREWHRSESGKPWVE